MAMKNSNYVLAALYFGSFLIWNKVVFLLENEEIKGDAAFRNVGKLICL